MKRSPKRLNGDWVAVLHPTGHDPYNSALSLWLVNRAQHELQSWKVEMLKKALIQAPQMCVAIAHPIEEEVFAFGQDEYFP